MSAGSRLPAHLLALGAPLGGAAAVGAAGHLVAIRDGDRASLQVHPTNERPAGRVRFGGAVPSAGTHVLSFDFARDGTVHTAPFVVTAEEASA